MPARIISSRTSSDDEAGPRVQSILVFHAVGWAANVRADNEANRGTRVSADLRVDPENLAVMPRAHRRVLANRNMLKVLLTLSARITYEEVGIPSASMP